MTRTPTDLPVSGDGIAGAFIDGLALIGAFHCPTAETLRIAQEIVVRRENGFGSRQAALNPAPRERP